LAKLIKYKIMILLELINFGIFILIQRIARLLRNVDNFYGNLPHITIMYRLKLNYSMNTCILL